MSSSEPVRISKSALLPYSDVQLFDLVNDIESYPNFLNGCSRAKILNTENGIVEAKLWLNKRGIEQSFSTRNTLYPHNRVAMKLIEGPFQSLDGEWLIKSLNEETSSETKNHGCKLSLDLRFTTGASLVMRMAAPFFADIGNKLVDAVVAEAHRRFGSATALELTTNHD